MSAVRVFCIDGVVVEIDRALVTRKLLDNYVLMPLEDYPIMSGILRDEGIELLTAMMADPFCADLNGRMIKDINTEVFAQVTEALAAPVDPDWP